MLKSYNGWSASPKSMDIGGLDNRDVPSAPGVKLAPGIRSGDAAKVLFHVAQQLHLRVEKGTMPGCWGYTFKASANSAALLSCHSSGTAFDWNAPRHPNGKRGTFTKAQVEEIANILAEVGNVVYWGGGGWNGGTVDEMHFEIAAPPTAVAKVAGRIAGGTAATTTVTPPKEEPDMTPAQEQALNEVHWMLEQMKPLTDRIDEIQEQVDKLAWAVTDPEQGLRTQVAAVQTKLAQG